MESKEEAPKKPIINLLGKVQQGIKLDIDAFSKNWEQVEENNRSL